MEEERPKAKSFIKLELTCYGTDSELSDLDEHCQTASGKTLDAKGLFFFSEKFLEIAKLTCQEMGASVSGGIAIPGGEASSYTQENDISPVIH